MNFPKSKFLQRRLLKHFQVTQLNYLSQKSLHPTPNHYKVLGVKETCSQKDIRDAFIAKSKELHPDKNPHLPQNHASLVAVNEAYSVLGKQHTRKLYDAKLMGQKYNHRVVFRGGHEHFENQPYYGIKGLKRLPNKYIAAAVVLLALFGSSFYFFLAHITATYNYDVHSRRERLAISSYNEVRARAKANGTDKQIEWFREQMEAYKVEKQQGPNDSKNQVEPT